MELKYSNLNNYPLFAIYDGIIRCIGCYKDFLEGKEKIDTLLKNALNLDTTNSEIVLVKEEWQKDIFCDGSARLYLAEIHINENEIIDICLDVEYKE